MTGELSEVAGVPPRKLVISPKRQHEIRAGGLLFTPPEVSSYQTPDQPPGEAFPPHGHRNDTVARRRLRKLRAWVSLTAGNGEKTSFVSKGCTESWVNSLLWGSPFGATQGALS